MSVPAPGLKGNCLYLILKTEERRLVSSMTYLHIRVSLAISTTATAALQVLRFIHPIDFQEHRNFKKKLGCHQISQTHPSKTQEVKVIFICTDSKHTSYRPMS